MTRLSSSRKIGVFCGRGDKNALALAKVAGRPVFIIIRAYDFGDGGGHTIGADRRD